MARKWYLYLAMFATLLAIGVIVLGAYVRLSQAGLGCPDWPGCYGHMSVPDTHQAIARADARYAGHPLETARAWKEMWHRYFAGSLALLILLLTVAAWWRTVERSGRSHSLTALVTSAGETVANSCGSSSTSLGFRCTAAITPSSVIRPSRLSLLAW